MPTCDSHQLHELLDSVPDTHEIVVRRHDEDDVLRAAWESARDDALEAWLRWTRVATRESWTVYVAARDREDAAVAAMSAGLGV